MNRRSKLLTALLVIAMLLCCVAIPVFADEAPAGPAQPGETVDESGNIVIKEGFTIPQAYVETYGDAETYPFAIFAKDPTETEWKYVTSVKFYAADTKTDYFWGYLQQAKADLGYMDVTVVLRRDYFCNYTLPDGSKSGDGQFNNMAHINQASVTVDFNNHNFTCNGYGIMFWNVKTLATGAGVESPLENGWTFNFKNGTIYRADSGLIKFAGGSTNKGQIFAKYLNINLENITVVEASEVLNVADKPHDNIAADCMELPEGVDVFKATVTCKNCKYETADGAAADLGAYTPLLTSSFGTEVNEKFTITVTCEHHDDDANDVCDLCGRIMSAHVTYDAALSTEKGVAVKLTATVFQGVGAIKYTVAGEETLVQLSTLTPLEGTTDVYEINIPVASMTDTVKVEFLEDGTGEPVKVRVGDELEYSTTLGALDLFQAGIETSDKALADQIQAVADNLVKAQTALQTAIDNKADAKTVADLAADLAKAIEDLEIADSDIKDMFYVDPEADTPVLITDVLAAADDTLEAAIAQLDADLEQAIADLNAAIAQGDSNLSDEIEALEAATAAANLAQSEALAAGLQAADKAMKDAVANLQKQLDDHTARLDAAEKMNTIQLVLIIVVGVAAIAGIVLPFVLGKGKKEEQE